MKHRIGNDRDRHERVVRSSPDETLRLHSLSILCQQTVTGDEDGNRALEVNRRGRGHVAKNVEGGRVGGGGLTLGGLDRDGHAGGKML